MNNDVNRSWRNVREQLGNIQLTWEEPYAFVISKRRERDTWRTKLSMVAMFVGYGVFEWYLRYYCYPKWHLFAWQTRYLLPLGIAVPVLILCGLWAVYRDEVLSRIFPSVINLGQNGIVRVRWKRTIPIPFKDVVHYVWLENDPKHFFTLRLYRKQGLLADFGVPDAVTRDRIEVVLQQARLKRLA